MSKIITWICIISLAYFTIPISFSQEFSFQPTTNNVNAKPKKMQYPAQRTPLSPDDFKKNVNNSNKKVQSDLSQQANQTANNLKGSGKRPTGTNNSSSQDLMQPPTQPKKIESNPTTSSQPAAPTSTQQPLQAPPAETDTTAAPLEQPAPQASPQEVYTGFPNAAPSGTSPQKSESDNGWNIQY